MLDGQLSAVALCWAKWDRVGKSGRGKGNGTGPSAPKERNSSQSMVLLEGASLEVSVQQIGRQDSQEQGTGVRSSQWFHAKNRVNEQSIFPSQTVTKTLRFCH
jgi:hypothetical protein